ASIREERHGRKTDLSPFSRVLVDNPFFDPGTDRMTSGKRIYALDTNVLLHDPTALFRFEEHDVFIPMTVLEELDEKKQGVSEVARNARQASRFLNELIERNNSHGIADG